MGKSIFLLLGTLIWWTIGSSCPLMVERHAVCELNIDRVVIGDCEYGLRTGNKSKVIVAVFISWVDPLPGEKIEIKLNGITQILDPFVKGCPPFVQFILDPDGGISLVEAGFVSGACNANPVNIQLPLSCDPPVCNGVRSIGGKVFSDYNNNGIQESSENGIPGLEVRLYDDAKQLHASTTTKTNGIWAVDSLNPGQKLRVEYQIPPGLFDANPGTENKTRTQMASVGSCNVNLGIYQLRSLIDPNPWMVTTCFAKGDASKPSSPSFNEPTIVANLYFTSEGGPRTGPNGNYYLASAGETGSVWGMCFQKESRKLFSGAFLKRNASLGPGGLGAIYLTDLNNFLPNPPVQPGFRYFGNTGILINLDSFGIQTGDESILFRNLPLTKFDASHDSISFDKIGKWGLGDLDLNDAGDTLFVVNLYNRSLISIAIGNPIVLPITADRIQEISIPEPGCKNSSDWRPWGLKYKDGVIYIGGVCSAETSGNSDDLRAVVYAFSNGIFSQVVDIELNYTKGFLDGNYCSTFRPWNHDFYYYHITRDIVCGPVPVLSDIEFDSEDNMIISLGDRYGYQSGGRDYGTNTKDGVRYITFAGGDNLKLFKLKNEYLLERNATSGYYTTLGFNNKQGVCGGEFYFQDGFYSHQESALGALASHPSYNTIVATLMDPANIWSNGWSQLDNSLGTKKVNYNIFTGENGTFGKAAGLGDIELLIGSSTPKGIGVSIGNYIWNDRDLDGIQDPGEPPLGNVPILLFDQNDVLLSQTLSDSNGLYHFLNLDPYTEYIIQIGADTNYINTDLTLSNKVYVSTSFQSRKNFGNSENDSDASQTLPLSLFFRNKVAFNYLTGKDGENNFSLDFGLIACDQIEPDTLLIEMCISDSIPIGNTWISKSNPEELLRFPNSRGYGCDSMLLVTASFHTPTLGNLDTSICEGTRIYIHSQFFDKDNLSGTIILTGKNQNGCDSILNINVQMLKPSHSNFDTTMCPNGRFVLHNQVFDVSNTSSTIVLNGANQYGCDSSITVNVQILPATRSHIDTSICEGSFIILHHHRFDETNPSGQIILTMGNQNACDSIIDVKLNMLPKTISKLDTSICYGSSFDFHGMRFDALNPSGQIVLTSLNQYGCDSIIDVKVKELPESVSQLDTSVCPGGSVNIHQVIFDESNRTGNIILSRANRVSCDSVVKVNLNFFPEYLFEDSIDACVHYYWPVNNINYKSSGDFRFMTKTKDGCDSIHLLKVRIHPEYKFRDTICVLKHFVWYLTGEEYKQSGVYHFNHRSSMGCDSIEQLFLVVAQVGEVYMPNVFSPNGDQINDRFFVQTNEDIEKIDVFAVYNRWGEEVFKKVHFPPNDPLYGWDGLFRNEHANPAVFVYRVEWRDKLGGRHEVKGNVTLIR